MTNPAEYLHNIALSDLQAYEDDEQAQILGQTTITLCYGPDNLILFGTWKGEHVDDIKQRIVTGHNAQGHRTYAENVTVRPWQRWFRKTEALRIVIGCPPLFQQAFDDGGPA